MGSSFFGLNIGVSGLFTAQAGLNMTAQNMANIETEGYTRQVLNQQSTQSLRAYASYGTVGTGVEVKSIEQMREEYYDVKYRAASTRLAEYNYKRTSMLELEAIFNEQPEYATGFSSECDQLFKSLNELSKNPSGLSERAEVVNYFQSFCEYFNSTAIRMQKVQEDANDMLKSKVDELNNYVQELATLNKQINSLEKHSRNANELRDERNLILDKISAIVPITVTEQVKGNGITSFVVTACGVNIVDDKEYVTLQVEARDEKANQTDVEGLYDLKWSNGAEFDMSGKYLSGALKGILDVRDGNNMYNFQGKTTVSPGDTEVIVSNLNVDTIHQLNIDKDGYININTSVYKYSEYEILDNGDGTYNVKFILEDEIKTGFTDVKASIGESVDYKGIPYYMTQLNELMRTFAQTMNDLQKKGIDLEGNPGSDLLVGIHTVSGEEGVYTNSAMSYNNMTALNVKVAEAQLRDHTKLSTSTGMIDDKDHNDIVSAMEQVREKKLFSSGTPDTFYQSMMVEMAIDTKKCDSMYNSQETILKGIKDRRMAVSSVDSDEEATNLLKYKGAYDLSAKIISILNEIYETTINGLGL